MKKYLPLLEKNVHWLAVAIGVGFLLYMVYANVVAPPVGVSVNGETLSPGEVEEYINTNAVTELEQKVKDDPRRVPPELQKRPEFVDVFPKPQPQPAVVATAFPNLAVSLINKPDTDPNTNQQQQGGNVVGQVVSALPTAPAPTNIRIDARRASVNLAPPDPANLNNPGAPPVAGSQQLADIDYVSVAFDVSMKDIAAEFQKTKIPAALMTSFLEVQLVRQEKNDNGEWGEEKVVEKLKNSEQPPAPDAKNRNAVQGYIAWAEQNQPAVVQPKFYEIVKGEQWILPGEKPVVVAGAGGQWAPRPANENEVRQGFDPANPPPDMTNAEKRAKYIYEQEKKRREQAEKNRNKPQPTPGGGRGGLPGMPGGGAGGMGEGGGFSNPAPAPGGFITFQVGAAGGDFPDGRAPGAYPPGFPPGGFPPGEFPGMPGYPGGQAQPSGPLPCPTTAFDPRVLNIDPVTGWAHDGSVQPGKTYRYKIRYSLKNPVFGAKGIANPPALADGHAIVSKDSEWSPEVSIGERAYYYVTRTNVNNGTAIFEVYTFGNGQWNVSNFTAAAGDAVGAKKDEVDYTTGYTVVDVRSERNDQVVVLADAEGNLRRRSLRSDSADQQRDKLKQQIAAGLPLPEGTPAGMPPGMPPGMPGYPNDGMPGMPQPPR